MLAILGLMIYFFDNFSWGVCSSKIGQLLCGPKFMEGIRKRLLDSAVSHWPGQGKVTLNGTKLNAMRTKVGKSIHSSLCLTLNFNVRLVTLVVFHALRPVELEHGKSFLLFCPCRGMQRSCSNYTCTTLVALLLAILVHVLPGWLI